MPWRMLLLEHEQPTALASVMESSKLHLPRPGKSVIYEVP